MITILQNGRRRVAGLAAATALLGAVTVGALVTGTQAATASGTADVSVSQRIAAGPASGQTVDNVVVRNTGGGGASYIEAVYLLKSASHGWAVRSSTSTPCAIVPAPAGYLGMVTCPLGSLAAGATTVDTLTWTGSVGVAFSVTASVGNGLGGDSNFANNTSTVSSWFGPRADLRLSGTLAPGSATGTATATTTVVNAGPNTASSLQQIIEIKATGLSSVIATASTPRASCQFVPAASGYRLAVACVTGSLPTGGKWTMTFAYKGAKGIAIETKSIITANSPADPVPANNSQVRSSHLK